MSKKKEGPVESVRLTELAKEFNHTSEVCLNLLKQNGLEEMYVQKLGRGSLRLFDKNKAFAILSKIKQEQQQQARQAREQEKLQSAPVDMDQLNSFIVQLGMLVKDVGDSNVAILKRTAETEQRVTELTVGYEALRKSTVDSIYALHNMVEGLCNRVKHSEESYQGLKQSVSLQLDLVLDSISTMSDKVSKLAVKQPEETAVQESVQVVQKKTEPTQVVSTQVSKPKPKICIVGLIPSQEQFIKKEYSDVFEIKYFQSDVAKGRSFRNNVASCSVVLAMTAFINHGIEDLIAASNGRLIRLTGGMSTLRSKLDEIKQKGEWLI